ncbi:MAG: thiolase family protein [Deltaproteobacteria bacterium]|nr:thiolase family protein [Deltaproteobacteria bacterium]
MSIKGQAAIVGVGETPVNRLGRKPGEPRTTMPEFLSQAALLAMEDAGLTKKDLDGQGLAAIYTTNYSQPFWPDEAAEILGISPGLLIGGGNGGASAVSLIGQASAAIHAGLVDLVLCVAASAPFVEAYGGVQGEDTREFEIPYGMMGPNSKIALVMRRHMHEYGTNLDHLGKIAVTSRYHASLNPRAYLKKPITLEDYKDSRLIADPIRLLDCVMPANGGKAYIVASPERAKKLAKPPVTVLGFGEKNNPSYGPKVQSNPLIMGIKDSGEAAFRMAGVSREEVDFLGLYDDYIIIVLMQIEDLGFCRKGDMKYFEATDFTFKGDLPIQTSGGLINCGQPSTAGGMVHVVEAVRQLRGEAGERQVKDAKIGLVTGLGGVAYGKNLSCTSVALLGRES